MTVLLLNRILPAGATIRLHQFPKTSRYAATGTDGSVVRKSPVTMSEARE
jgi:hypothetical protein